MSVPEIHRDGFVRCITTFQHALGDGVLQFLLDGALERACAIQRIEAHLGQFVECGFADFQLEVALGQAFLQALELDDRDVADVLGVQAVEDHHFVDPVDEFRPEVLAHLTHHGFLDHVRIVQRLVG